MLVPLQVQLRRVPHVRVVGQIPPLPQPVTMLRPQAVAMLRRQAVAMLPVDPHSQLGRHVVVRVSGCQMLWEVAVNWRLNSRLRLGVLEELVER